VYPEAKANAERGYALDPHSRETCTILGGIRDWFEHRWDETFKLYDRALELQPGYAPAHFFLGMALLCQRNIPTAEAALRRSTDLDPRPPATAHGWVMHGFSRCNDCGLTFKRI